MNIANTLPRSGAALPRSGTALAALNAELEALPLAGLLHWAVDAFGARLAHVTSLGPSGLVILDHLLRVDAHARVLTVDTGFLFAETYELWAALEARYAIRIESVASPLSPWQQEQQYGPALWALEPDICCDLRKVQPLAQALAGCDAWTTGIRRDQGGARASAALLAWDARYGLFKLAPLAAWTRAQVWDYIHAHGIPYNRKHDEGYTSIGCIHCTRPPLNAADERSGRWAGSAKTECGLHAPVQPRGCA